MRRLYVAIVALITSGGCQLQVQRPEPAVPALLAESSQGDLNQISLVISKGLKMRTDNIRLSRSVFTQTNLLIIQRQPLKANPRLHSADDLLHHFSLLKNSHGCLIHHRQSSREWRLENLRCTVWQ